MANSIGYLLSLNAYSTGAEAAAESVSQGARVVYATTDTLSTSNLLYGDSRLTQPVFGVVGDYYGIQLLTDDAVKYVVTFNETGAITFYTTTTTTGAPTTTTTTAAPTTTTTTTTTYSFSVYTGTTQFAACQHSNPMLTVYTSSPALNVGVDLYTDAALTVIYNRPVYGMYLSSYFAADDQVCTMGGALGNTITSFVPCSGVTTTTTTTAAP
jgi:hypothetical protein